MSIKPDSWIRRMCREHAMIEPFEEKQVRAGVISYGVSSYGYDIRIADEFKIFTNVNSAIVDPKRMDPGSMVDFKGDVALIPPNSFALGRTVEYFRIPRNVLTICVGKCLAADTRVVDGETGDLVALSEFVRRRAGGTVCLNGSRLEAGAVSQHVHSGFQPVSLLTTRAGLEIKATASHPFRTFDGWKSLRDLAPGERISSARSLPWLGTREWPEHEATMLGLMLADGQCCTPGSSPRFTTGDPRLADAMHEAVRAFGCELSPVDAFGFNLVNHRGRGGSPAVNRVSQWLRGLGCAVRSAEKHVPSVVFTARRDRAAAFLRALFSGDGSAWQSGEGVAIEYTSISKRLVHDVRHLLLRFGVFALIREREVPSGGSSFRVQITDREMIARFSREVGFIPGSRKAAALARVVESIQAAPRRRSNFDTLPPAAWTVLRRSALHAGVTLRSLGVERTLPAQSMGLALASRAAVALGDAEFTDCAESDIVWDTVRSITPVGVQEVFDVTVPGRHNFVANDLIVHNSTYARCGIITNVTPFEPEWEGFVTLEISNTTPLPAKIYANEGIAQVLFFESDTPCETSYKDKAGKYQAQTGITLPRL